MIIFPDISHKQVRPADYSFLFSTVFLTFLVAPCPSGQMERWCSGGAVCRALTDAFLPAPLVAAHLLMATLSSWRRVSVVEACREGWTENAGTCIPADLFL